MKFFKLNCIILVCLMSCNTGHENVRSFNKDTCIYISKEGLNSKYVIGYLDNNLNEMLLNSTIIGDSILYDSLSAYYDFSLHEKELLFYSLNMAENYNYKNAFENVYYILKEAKVKNKSILKNMRYYYLLKSYNLGSENAKYELSKEFGKNIDSLNLIKKLSEFEDYITKFNFN